MSFTCLHVVTLGEVGEGDVADHNHVQHCVGDLQRHDGADRSWKGLVLSFQSHRPSENVFRGVCPPGLLVALIGSAALSPVEFTSDLIILLFVVGTKA